MKIVVFGATGIVGKTVVDEALKKGHEVTVLTRDARKVTTRNQNLHVVEGNVADRSSVRNVLKGQEAVIQTLGIGGKGDGKPTSIVSEANKIIMEEMERMNVKRLVAISVIGAGDSLTFLPWIYRKLVLPLFMKWFQAVIDDKNRMEPMIKRSGLDYRALYHRKGTSGHRKSERYTGWKRIEVQHFGGRHGCIHGRSIDGQRFLETKSDY